MKSSDISRKLNSNSFNVLDCIIHAFSLVHMRLERPADVLLQRGFKETDVLE